METLTIFTPTYNRAKFLPRAFEALKRQTLKDFLWMIIDDGSTDRTVEILDDYKQRGLIDYCVGENLKPAKSFLTALLDCERADYYAFSDQDDIWEKNKIELTLKEFENVNKPLLVHSDLSVIDENNNVVCKSMIKSQHINVNRIALNQLIVQNVVTGCTMAFNRQLADIIVEPELLSVHDWWIAATASIFGEIKFINKPTIKYRKHNNNACGPQNMSSPAYVAKRATNKTKAKKMLDYGYVMAVELLEKYKIPYKYKAMLKAYGAMGNKNKFNKLKTVFKYNIWKSGVIRKIGQIWFM